MSFLKNVGIFIAVSGLILFFIGLIIAYVSAYPDPAYAWIFIAVGLVMAIGGLFISAFGT